MLAADTRRISIHERVEEFVQPLAEPEPQMDYAACAVARTWRNGYNGQPAGGRYPGGAMRGGGPR